MNLFDIAAVLFSLAAFFGYINHRYLKLDPSVGLLAISLVSSLGVMLLDGLAPGLDLIASVRDYMANIDFNEALMHGMLAFLLFAGALHADLDYFAKRKTTITLLATVGLMISTVLVALFSKGIFALLGLEASWLACLVFGALISPTDPISVMATLKTLHAPKELEAKIAGESLFNDGVAVVVFTGLVALMQSHAGAGAELAEHGAAALQHGAGAAPAAAGHGHAPLGVGGLLLLFLREAGGGVVLGLVAGYIAYRMMLSIDDYKVEVMITLGLVMGGYFLAFQLHVSGPIAMVVAGLLIGNRGRNFAMSEEVADYVEKFWELLDEMLNAVLFLLIGIEVLAVVFDLQVVVAGLLMIPAVLLARLASVSASVGLVRIRRTFIPGVVRILTWAGLRGGISVALALSLPPVPEKQLLLACTYLVVLFSILVQGMTIRNVLRQFI
jgi:CPA1 family monovalent cation:H+ antiporter